MVPLSLSNQMLILFNYEKSPHFLQTQIRPSIIQNSAFTCRQDGLHQEEDAELGQRDGQRDREGGAVGEGGREDQRHRRPVRRTGRPQGPMFTHFFSCR